MSSSDSNPDAKIKIIGMDDMVNLLGAAAISEKAGKVSTFENLYKNRGRCGNQDERRKSILEIQKGNRNSKLDKFRGILMLVEAIEKNIFKTPTTPWKPTCFVSGFTNRVPNYCDVLMMSEWMYGKPADLEENWNVALCPKGIRMLVIAHKGTTKCFNKYGHFRFECRTELPGGNPCQIKKDKCIVVLDAFYVKNLNTMYVLDILAWNECVMTEGESTFRDFWINSHLQQIEELNRITKKNKMIFQIIPKFPCTTESLNEIFASFPFYPKNIPAVDGLLFFHKHAHYIAGETPMVAWLYPYMIKEVLGDDIQVHPAYLMERPEGYRNYIDFIEEFESRNSRKRQRKIFAPRDMDTGERIDPEKNASASTLSEFPQLVPVENLGEKGTDTISGIEDMEADTKTGENVEAMVAVNETVGSTNGNAEAGVQLTKAGQDTVLETGKIGDNASTEDKMEAMVSDNAAVGFTNGNGVGFKEGGGDSEFGAKIESETESMEAMVADLVEDRVK